MGTLDRSMLAASEGVTPSRHHHQQKTDPNDVALADHHRYYAITATTTLNFWTIFSLYHS